MSGRMFFCAGEQEQFPISELSHDAQGQAVHIVGHSCHFVLSGIPCLEPPDPSLPFREPHFSLMVYEQLPDEHKAE